MVETTKKIHCFFMSLLNLDKFDIYQSSASNRHVPVDRSSVEHIFAVSENRLQCQIWGHI